MTALNLTVALATQWRATTADAVYAFPSFPVAGTAGRPGRYTGTYVELRADWMLTANYAIGLGSRALRDRQRGSPGGRPRRQLRWRRTQICVVRLRASFNVCRIAFGAGR